MKPLILCLLPIFVLSVPSNWKEIKTFTQPDGLQFEGRLIGDEHFSFVEDIDGYVYVRNADGWWTYAKLEDGLLKPTANIAFRDAPVAPPHIRPSAEAIAKLPENQNKNINRYFYNLQEEMEKLKRLGKENAGYEERSTLLGLTGSNALICLLSRFTDSSFNWRNWETDSSKYERRHFMGLAFGDSVPPYVPDSSVYSMNNYFWEATYSKLKWTGDVDSIRSSGMTRASANTSTTTYITNACSAADATVNFASFDLDSDGDVDQLIVIHPGRGEEESGVAADIWSASYTGSFGTYDGKTVNRAVVIPENAKLGVFCHELFHQFAGAPDLYDYGYDGDPVADFCLMASGSWNGDPGGTKPSHMCGLLKLEVDGQWALGSGGWLPAAAVKDTTESSTCGKYNITQLDSQPGTTRDYERLYLVRNQNLLDSNQMLVIENRQKTGRYESGLPRSGLVIYHLDRRMAASRLNDGPYSVRYYYFFTERNLFDPNWYYYLTTFIPPGTDSTQFSPSDFYAPFAAEYGFTRFDSLTVPNNGINWRWNSTPYKFGPKITGISTSGYNMSFNIAGVATIPPANTGIAIKYYSHAIKDPVTTGMNNNNNGLFEAGELDTLVLTFYSSGGSAASVTESLYTADPYVTIVNPHKTSLGTMANNTFASNTSNPYLVRVAFNAPSNYTVQFKYKVTATGYTDSGLVFIDINKPYIAYRFTPGPLTHPKFRPMAIAAYYDTIFVSDGDSISYTGTALWRLYKFNTNTNTLIASNNRPGAQSYVGAGDIKGDTVFWSIGDSCIKTNRALSRIGGFMHHNSSWGTNVRARGISIAPADAPTGYGADSTFIYWQNFGASNDVMEESVKVVSRPNSGSCTWRRSWVIPEGGNPPQDHWRNGRGLEHDGWRLWRICLFTNEIYRSRAPVGTSTSIDTLFVMNNPNHWGAYPGYDIDFQGRSSSGGQPHTPYARGNKFYLWTTNIDDSEIFKLDVTGVVLPSPVKNVTANRVGTNNYVIWDEKNYSTNPDSVDKTNRYVVYRTHALIMDQVGESIGVFTARTNCSRDTFTDINPPLGLLSTTVYYRVSAVNYFGFIPGHSNRSPGIIGVEEGDNKPLTFMFYNIAPNITNRRLPLKFEIAEPCVVNLKIYNSMGALVKTFATGKKKAGVYNLIWDLKDNEKRTLANGIYFVKFGTDKNYERTQKIILVR